MVFGFQATHIRPLANPKGFCLEDHLQIYAALVNTQMQFFLYALAGGAATFVHYVALIALVELASLAAAPAAVIGALIGALVSFTLNFKLTFSNSGAQAQRAMFRFMLTATAGAALSGALVWVSVHWLNWHYLLAQAAATVLLLLLTYQINRRWSFAK